LAREEQQRINRELDHAGKVLATAEVSYEHIEETLNRTLALVVSAYAFRCRARYA
jgi:hypothetical protein